ncbi:helix-turn-helix domain-containing protein [Embleya sp. NPDC005971]|uniref:helix-turn-helix domain-containing protein n=1 Tax=Embleya sp. NPDC005971 TaxID=3156724 RepID=UPI0033CF9A0D
MSLDWTPAAVAFAAARKAMALTQPDLAKLADVSRNTISNLESRTRIYDTIPKSSVVKVGHVFGWPDPIRDVERIIAGAPAPPTNPPSRTRAAVTEATGRPMSPSAIESMPLRVRRKLETNELVDHKIIEVDGLEMVVLLTARPGDPVSDSQMASGLAAWADLERNRRDLDITDRDQENS